MSKEATTLYKLIPGPHGSPLVGVIPELRKDPLQFFLNTAIEYGDVVQLNMGLRKMFLVTRPDSIKWILHENNRNYRKNYEQAKPLMGEGLVTSEGEFWLRQRRIIQPLFLEKSIQAYTDVMLERCQVMLERWNSYSQGTGSINIAEEMMRLTQDIILRTMFSTSIGDESTLIAQAFDTTLEHLNQTLFSPHEIFQKIPTPANIRNHKALKMLDHFVYELIKERKKLDVNAAETSDLLTKLLASRDPQTGLGMDDKQIRDEIMTIFLAGHETTANALAWAWYLIAQHPQIQDKLYDEIDNVIKGRIPSVHDLPDLVYSRMIFDETLRLYPPAWMFARTNIHDDEIGGYRIPAGTMLMISPYITHHLPDIWVDPFKFIPERFTPESTRQRHKYAYFPFGGGPRICLGNTFAVTEALLIMASIAQKYHLALDTSVEVRPVPVATLQPKPGVFMQIIKRRT